MQVKSIIPANPEEKKYFQKDGEYFLKVSEFYYDTIQGEGIYIGHPAAVLRLQGCTLNCSYCDTNEVWRHGNPYTHLELLTLISSTFLVAKLRHGQHLILTGGSPLLQQEQFHYFILNFFTIYGFRPFIEIENECIIMPEPHWTECISCWNNSPKLLGSGLPLKDRYKPDVIRYLSGLANSWFKFVIEGEEDWEEIVEQFLATRLIKKEQVILMPKGATRQELHMNRETVVDMAIRHGVRYCSREHIVLWDKKIGV